MLRRVSLAAALLYCGGAHAQTITGSGPFVPLAPIGQTLPNLPAVPMQGVAGGQAVDNVVKGTPVSRSTILPVQEAGAAASAGGSGNAVGDVLTFVGGSSTVPVSATLATPAKCTVISVSSGAVTGCTPLGSFLGSYTSIPANPVATTSTGSGTGATINVTWTGLSVQIAPANPTRRGVQVMPIGGVGWLNDIGQATTDQNSLPINPGILYENVPQFVSVGALFMIAGGTTPLQIYGREF